MYKEKKGGHSLLSLPLMEAKAYSLADWQSVELNGYMARLDLASYGTKSQKSRILLWNNPIQSSLLPGVHCSICGMPESFGLRLVRR
jgi:hypothetical protein